NAFFIPICRLMSEKEISAFKISCVEDCCGGSFLSSQEKNESVIISKRAKTGIFLSSFINHHLKKRRKYLEIPSPLSRKYHLHLTGCYTFKEIIHAIYPFLSIIPQLFPDTSHPVCNNLPDKQPHIVALHGIPGILYIYRERYNTYQEKQVHFFD